MPLQLAQRVGQSRIDDSVVLGQKRRAEHPSGCDQNAASRITVKGIGQRSQLRRDHGRDAETPYQRGRYRFDEPFPQGDAQPNAAQAVQGRHFPERDVGRQYRRLCADRLHASC